MARLEGKTAVVTGGAMGIGKAIAERLAEEGATVAIGDIDADALTATVSGLETLTGQGGAIGVLGDVTEEADAAELVRRATQSFGKVDILVNNVGGGAAGKAWEMSVDDFDATIRVNLRGMFLCTRAVLPGMMERRDGRIVCISSGAREGVPWISNITGGTGYATAKAGIVGYVRDLALQLGEHDVRINALAVGAVATDKLADFFQHINDTFPLSPKTLVPLKRVARPREIADAALFLASDESSYITGTVMNVNGGRT